MTWDAKKKRIETRRRAAAALLPRRRRDPEPVVEPDMAELERLTAPAPAVESDPATPKPTGKK